LGVTDANEALVRRAYDAWNRNDWAELGQIYDADVVAVSPEGFIEPGEYRGWPALERRYRELKAAWEGEEIEVMTLVSEGDQVAAKVRWYGTGRASGAPISLEVTNLVDVRDGRIVRLEYYWEFDEAVAAMRAGTQTEREAHRPPG
jgi:ketosteroid isomerase-like protein